MQSNTWSDIKPLSTPRSKFAAAALPNGRIYAMGGKHPVLCTPT